METGEICPQGGASQRHADEAEEEIRSSTWISAFAEMTLSLLFRGLFAEVSLRV